MSSGVSHTRNDFLCAAIVCIVDLSISGKGRESPLSVYMVFPYMDHDLAGLLENERVKLTVSQIKLYMKQLIEGTEYMHRVRSILFNAKTSRLISITRTISCIET